MKEDSSSSSTILLFFFLYSVLVFVSSTAEAKIKLPGNETVPAVIMFGDSIVDTGNNNNLRSVVKCNFSPYGRDFKGGMPTGRFSNGKVPSDLLVEELGIKELLPAYVDPSLKPNDLLTGVSFASGGSGYDPLTSNLVSVTPLSTQLQQFNEYIGKLKSNFGEERTNFILSKSGVIVVAGSNDLANSYFTTGIRKLQYDIPSYTDLMLKHASAFVKELYGMGARRIGVFSAPPIGCVPSMRTLGGGLQRDCVHEANEAAKLFNAKLSAEIDHLNNNLPQAKVVYINVYDPLFYIIKNPTKYGFQVADKGCCGTGTLEVAILCNRLELHTCRYDSNYVFWDSYHPTEKTYRIIVRRVLQKYITRFY
ncbi:GDSL esterase/lipase [Quillaja saponaria]|uniref:GDSL esterase/lipase n=1 Tax=Quillaja saponaria TaxID=32244 RepID=A0AAD7PTU6_QUISA|nr:GDSL esterase/lipase [Quillaja saponaria]